METKGNDSKEDKKKLRRWILKAASDATSKTGIPWIQIKKFVNSKQAGLAEAPQAKEILKKLVDDGLIQKVDKNYAFNASKKSGKKMPSTKDAKKMVVKKDAKKIAVKKNAKKVSSPKKTTKKMSPAKQG